MRIRSCVALALILTSGLVSAESISGRWELEASRSSVGQGLTLTLQIQGADKFSPPDLSAPGVSIVFRGGGPRNSTSIVSVNGKTTKTVSKSWVGSWTLTAASPGSYHIDGRTWNVGGASITLDSLDWQVLPAVSDDHFSLVQRVEPSTCVPGVPVKYTLVWYLGASAQNPEFSLPILDDANLDPVDASFSVPSGDTFQLEYRGRTIAGVKSIETLGGKQYTALTISFSVTPSKSGSYDLSGTMVGFEGAVETRQVQDFFGNIVSQPVYRSLTAQANPVTLKVAELPANGKPNPFSGLIGKVSLSWDETPEGNFSVGEPIRMRLRLSGVLNMKDVDLDHLVSSALAGGDFQVSPDPSAKDEDGSRSFVFRGRHAGRLVIPTLALSYYDPSTGRYGTTATKELSFAISSSTAPGSAAATGFGAIAAQTSSPGDAAASRSGMGPLSPSSRLDARLSRLNPNGLDRPFLPSLPWWSFAIPGFVAGFALLIAAGWKHSQWRILRSERASWKDSLRAPLTDVARNGEGGRNVLEAGRHRFSTLLGAGALWKKRLESDGRWANLVSSARAWDEAFFSGSRDGEPWAERWVEMRRRMEEWK